MSRTVRIAEGAAWLALGCAAWVAGMGYIAAVTVKDWLRPGEREC